jgi:hypothetical protein
MRAAILFALLAPLLTGVEPDPAELKVTFDGHALSYEVVSHLPYRIAGFEVYTQFLSGGFEALACGVRAEVKKPSDLVVRDVCTIPRDSKTGEPIRFASRIVEVKYFNGLKWTPVEKTEAQEKSQ